MRPGRLDLAGGRWVPFVQTLTFKGIDLTGALFLAQIRLTADASGVALVNLPPSGAGEGIQFVYGGTTTVAAHVAAGRLIAIPAGMIGGDSLALSIIGITIAEATMEGLPYPEERGADAGLAWDIHITPLGGIKQKWLGGTFTVEAGVTV